MAFFAEPILADGFLPAGFRAEAFLAAALLPLLLRTAVFLFMRGNLH